jgi:hypothetical protein
MYSVSDDGQTYIVAGRYYVHRFCKKTMQWDLVYNDRDFTMSIGDRRKMQQMEKIKGPRSKPKKRARVNSDSENSRIKSNKRARANSDSDDSRSKLKKKIKHNNSDSDD